MIKNITTHSELPSEITKNTILIAPTGWGKTSYAISLLKKAKKYYVYTTPLKSILSEVSRKVPMTVYTGDVYVQENEPETPAIGTTYEKLDSLIRSRKPWAKEISLLIIDELHNISKRPAIELLIVYALRNSIPVLALSGTLKNVEEMGKWMGADIYNVTQRSIELKFGYYEGDKIKDAKGAILFEGSPSKLFKNKRALVFKATRRRVIEYAKSVGGCIYFSSYPDKEESLRKFERGECSPLVSTTALGQGVNIPVDVVFFDDWFIPVVINGKFVGYDELSENEILQISGRAGRPGLSNEALIVFPYYSVFSMYNFEPTEVYSPLDNYTFMLYTLHVFHDISYYKYHFTKELDDQDFVLKELEKHGLVKNNEITKLGEAVMRSYLPMEDAIHFAESSNKKPLDLLLSAPGLSDAKYKKIAMSLLNGKPIVEISRETHMYPNDVNKMVDTLRWYSYGMWLIRYVMDGYEKAKKYFMLHMNLTVEHI